MNARFWLTAICSTFCIQASAADTATSFPDKLVRIIAPTAPGSAPDIVARLLAENLGRQWKHQVIVENKPGGNGIIGMNTLTREPADGYTLGMFHAAAAVTTPFLYQAAKFDIERDTEVVATLGYTPMMLVTKPDSPYRSIDDLLSAATNGEQSDLTIGSPTRGSIPSLSVYLLGQKGDRDFRQISFSGTTQALQTLMVGDIPVYIDGVAPLVPLVQAGKLRTIALSADEPLPGFESVPLIKDTVPGVVTSGWFALFAPKGTPTAVLERINTSVNEILRDPQSVARLADLGIFPMVRTRDEASTFVHNEKTLWGNVIKQANIKAE